MTDMIAVSNRLFAKYRRMGFEHLSAAEQVFHVVWQFEAEINNGGFDQFFFNSTGDYTAETISALETIRARHNAKYLRRACERFPGSLPSRQRSRRQEELSTITQEGKNPFGDLDDEFYKYPEDITGLLTAYWASQGEA